MEIYTCDLCGQEKPVRPISLPVRWTTEQNEGRPITPVIIMESLDLCDECLDSVTRINASGAQGIKKFEIRPIR